MPFAPIEALPPEEPAVRVYFTGLMILEPAANNACQIFVNSSATRHVLTVEVRRKTRNRPDVILMRHVGPLAFVGDESNPQNPPIHGLFIEKLTEGAKGVKKYMGNSIGPLGEESFASVIDMEAPAFHNGNPPVDPDLVSGAARNLLDIDNLAGRPSILLDDGILHTAVKTRQDLTILLKKRGQEPRELPPFASVVGANLYLNNDQEQVLLMWRNQGKFAALELRKPADGVSYEIYIANDPLYEAGEVATAFHPKHDEFGEYYKLLTAVPTNDQFRLHVQPPPQGAPPLEKGSTDIPCMPVGKGG